MANVVLYLKVYKPFFITVRLPVLLKQSYQPQLQFINVSLKDVKLHFTSKTVKSKTVKPRLTDFTVRSFFQDSKQPCLSCKIDIYNGLTNLKSAFFFCLFFQTWFKNL